MVFASTATRFIGIVSAPDEALRCGRVAGVDADDELLEKRVSEYSCTESECRLKMGRWYPMGSPDADVLLFVVV